MVMKKTIDKYADFVANNTWVICIIVGILFVGALFLAQQVEVENIDLNNILPSDLDVIKSMDILEDDFGGTDSAQIIIELDSLHSFSSEPRDIRTYEILKYQENIQKSIQSLTDVSSSTSATDIVKSLNGKLLTSDREIIDLMKDNPSFTSYISSDKTISLIQVRLNDDFDKTIGTELNNIIETIPRPDGLKVEIGGSSIEKGELLKLTSEDMGRTSMFSMISIFLVLIILAGSFRYGLIPLSTIIVGVVWTMGFIGLIGMNLNTATSAVISMIMGIGIDFGIQITTRFREEKDKHVTIRKSMRVTMESVLYPMIITTLAAIIGFWSMGLGSIKILGEMGTIMMFGVIMCFLSAITIVPSILIITEHFVLRKQSKEV